MGCRVIGHRGASHDHPENTIAAFEGARAQGADWVELDVRRTADGELVVHHDAHLPDGRVIAEVARTDLPSAVPTLAAALAASPPMGVNVEIKNTPGEAGFDESRELAAQVLATIRAAEVEVLISSFDAPTIDACRAADPDMPTAFLVFGVDEPIDAVGVAVEGGHGAIHPWNALLTEEHVTRAHAAGLIVNVWTVDDPERIAQLASWGVDGIVTNRPAVALAALGRGVSLRPPGEG